MTKPRRFFLWGFSSDESLEDIDSYEDPVGFFFPIGQKFEGPLPDGIRLILRPGRPSDILANPLCLEVVSNRLWDSIAHLIQPDCQIFPNAPVYHPDTNDRVDGFSIINPWRKQRLLPEGAGGKDMTIMELRVDHTVVDKNLHIFHPAESEELIVVSEELVKAIRKNKLVGFDFWVIQPYAESM